MRLCFVQIAAIQASWVELFQSVRFVCLRQVVPNSMQSYLFGPAFVENASADVNQRISFVQKRRLPHLAQLRFPVLNGSTLPSFV